MFSTLVVSNQGNSNRYFLGSSHEITSVTVTISVRNAGMSVTAVQPLRSRFRAPVSAGI